MKKLISIDHLAVGMFLEANIVKVSRDGDEQHFLAVHDAVSTAPEEPKARLAGHLPEKVTADGGLLLTSENQIGALRSIGLSMVTISTEKGTDLPNHARPLTDPDRQPPPLGRRVHFDEEIDKARQVRRHTAEVLKSALENMATLHSIDVEKIQSTGQALAESILRNMDAMVSLTRLKEHDPYSALHSVNVCILVAVLVLADGAAPSTLPAIITATLLHDIGKIRVPQEILNKPGRFEPHELQAMHQHPLYSGEMLAEIDGFTPDMIAIATQHHERLDGSGYPHGLKGDQIHRLARMTAVADIYDALTSPRAYRPALSLHKALLHIYQNRGVKFDEQIVDLFTKTLGIYPVGSLVELNTRERGLVYEPNSEEGRRPTVGILTRPNQKLRRAPYIVNLAARSEAGGREITRVLDPQSVGMDTEKLLQVIHTNGERTENRMR